jgi:tRNA-dihydrouridine synthase B
MRNPILAGEIVKSMVKAEEISANKSGRLRKPITVKCRIGWDENSINLQEFASRIEDAGASALTVHGRTRDQMYSGKADWESIAEAKKRLSIPVIGNGDAHTAGDAVRMLKETGCDFVMIARGALGNPWIFREALELYRSHRGEGASYNIADIDSGEKLQMIKKHIDLLVEEKGQRRGVQEMRKHMGWYLKGTPGAAKFRNKINMASTLEDVYAFLEDLKALIG